ncbi:MAG: CocE/NonD family hydrolase, partial [Longimicrobiales bacterium]|nr:CocE/NonD family hydrolase [Longimicrobiales bacterium]
SVYTPEEGGPFPVVLARTPYDKASGSRSFRRYTDAGYAYVIQDQRGMDRSEGIYVPYENELHDGYDTVEWIALQPWSNGRVGMTGSSALGIAANLAAAADPPHLVANWVRVAPRSLLMERAFIGGIFKEYHMESWLGGQGVSDEFIDAYRKRVVIDQRWKETDLLWHRHNIDIPIYNSGGWYDLFSYGTVMNFQYLQNWGREGAKGNQKLMVGPIGHGSLAGGLEYPNPTVESDEELRWFDYWLKGIDNGIMDEPPVRYYMMAGAKKGAPSPRNGWRTADQWPPTESTRTPFFLQPDGGLSREGPSSGSASTSYDFDPSNPVPTAGGLNLRLPIGPVDQREIGERDDYLRFETEPLEEPVTIAGKIDMELWAATDGPDTDFIVKLVDVYPDGYEALVLDMGLRARYRHGRRPEVVEMMTPGEPTRLQIDLWNSAITFEEGHRIAVHVTSSNSPRFEVNPNTGEPPGESRMEPRVARNTIFHSAEHPSAILLPVLCGCEDR